MTATPSHVPAAHLEDAELLRLADGEGGALVSFTPGAGPFTIRFDVHPMGGSLTLVARGTQATAERLDGPSDELVVMPHELRVRNAATLTGRYRIGVPSQAGPVRVQFGPVPSSRDILVQLVPGQPYSIDFAVVGTRRR